MPSSFAFVSLITTTAAAPSLSGHALPAVTLPSGRNTGFSVASFSTRRAGARAVVLRHDRAVGERDRRDLALEEPVLLRCSTASCCERAPNSSISSRLTLSASAHVLGGLAHRDVDVGETRRRASTSAGRPRSAASCRSRAASNFSFGGPAVGHAVHEPADGLDAAGDEDVALAGLDRVRRHADRLQRRRAVAVHRDARRVDAREERGDPGDVRARLAGGLAAAPDDVLDLRGIEARNLGEHRLDDRAPRGRRGGTRRASPCSPARSACGRWRR